ncbi:hypothetical protein [Rhodococcus sp. ACS1]|uniref:hypothetical protein n=1 Tax=Rhodococcus sp. ACS1 TaxID=2028570 RepID=UPI0015CBC2D9|nr:hypothetical protein [Rhodococcus sp. ACS1]
MEAEILKRALDALSDIHYRALDITDEADKISPDVEHIDSLAIDIVALAKPFI